MSLEVGTQAEEADDRMKVALDEIEQRIGGWGSHHPAVMQEFFSEYGVEKLKAGHMTVHPTATVMATARV
jgi:hypothetical protein